MAAFDRTVSCSGGAVVEKLGNTALRYYDISTDFVCMHVDGKPAPQHQ